MGILDFDDNYDATKRKENRRKVESTANQLLKRKKTRRGKKIKNKKKIPKMSYKLYMGSAYWKKRKLLYWSKFTKKCFICGKKEGTTLHHKRYDVTFGAEPDDAFVALCRFHHLQFHAHHELKRNMTKDTDAYLLEAKQTHLQYQDTNLDDLSWIQLSTEETSRKEKTKYYRQMDWNKEFNVTPEQVADEVKRIKLETKRYGKISMHL